MIMMGVFRHLNVAKNHGHQIMKKDVERILIVNIVILMLQYA